MTYHLARASGPNDTVLWLSTPEADLDYLARLAAEAERRTLRAALSRGRASQAYADALADQTAVEAELTLAQSRVDLTVPSILQDSVLKVESEYVTVRFPGEDTVEVGRAGYGTARASHPAGAEVFPVILRVVASFDVELIVEGSPVSAGDKGDHVWAESGVISSVRLAADQPGDLVLDVRRSAFPALPDSPLDSVVGGNYPTLSASQTYVDSALAGWDVDYSSGDVFRFVVLSASTVTRVTVALTCTTSL